MKYSLLLASALMFSAACQTAHAVEFQCEVPGVQRTIRVEIPGRDNLCEVSVTDIATGERSVKWLANSDTLFCSARAYEMRDKYEARWGFTCTKGTDSDGTDRLSASQRAILDTELKRMIRDAAERGTRVESVRVVASTPLDRTPGKLAIQFFTSNGNFTRIIDDQVDEWRVAIEVGPLETLVDGHSEGSSARQAGTLDTVSDAEVTQAVLASIDEEGMIQVETELALKQSTEQTMSCTGQQTLTLSNDAMALVPETPHRFVCSGTP